MCGTGQRPLDSNHENLLRPPEENPGATQDDLDAQEDARLLYAIAGGDERALAMLYQRRSGLVFSLLTRMLGHEAEAQEALQDTFIRLWRRAKDFDAGRSSATAWLLLFARGLALDRLRARSRHVAKLSAYEREVAALEGGGGDGAPDELASACRAALESCPRTSAARWSWPSSVGGPIRKFPPPKAKRWAPSRRASGMVSWPCEKP